MTDYRNDMTKEAVEERDHAAQLGFALGQRLRAHAATELEDMGIDPNIDPYLEYVIWISAAQVIKNEGRRIGGVDFGKSDKELEGRKR